jgi:serine O-acetyltransferase
MAVAAPSRSRVSDLLWVRLRQEAERTVRAEPVLGGFVFTSILSQPSLEAALLHRLAERLGTAGGGLSKLLLQEAVEGDNSFGHAVRLDLLAFLDRDPATSSALTPFLYFKGFQALQTHRIAHALWRAGRRDFALHLQDKASEVFQVDIHPAVPVGLGIFIDHATGISVGETATIGDNVSLLQGVVLGPSENDRTGRHPRIGDGVMIGAGARILGDVAIGRCSRVGAGSMVVADVPPNVTVAGIPARIVGPAGCAEPSRTMDQMFYDVGL